MAVGFSIFKLNFVIFLKLFYSFSHRQNHGACLLDKPKRDMIEPSSANSRLAGEKFTDDQQCELVFGPSSKICSYMVCCF